MKLKKINTPTEGGLDSGDIEFVTEGAKLVEVIIHSLDLRLRLTDYGVLAAFVPEPPAKKMFHSITGQIAGVEVAEIIEDACESQLRFEELVKAGATVTRQTVELPVDEAGNILDDYNEHAEEDILV